jgi:hypothetical protein
VFRHEKNKGNKSIKEEIREKSNSNQNSKKNEERKVRSELARIALSDEVQRMEVEDRGD